MWKSTPLMETPTGMSLPAVARGLEHRVAPLMSVYVAHTGHVTSVLDFPVTYTAVVVAVLSNWHFISADARNGPPCRVRVTAVPPFSPLMGADAGVMDRTDGTA